MSSFWWHFHHWLHWKLSFWQLPVQLVMKISSKWQHFRFSDWCKYGSIIFCDLFFSKYFKQMAITHTLPTQVRYEVGNFFLSILEENDCVSTNKLLLTTSKNLTGIVKFGFFLAFCMTEEDSICPAHSMSIRGWSTEVNWIRFRSRTPQKSIWKYKQIITFIYIYLSA